MKIYKSIFSLVAILMATFAFLSCGASSNDDAPQNVEIVSMSPEGTIPVAGGTLTFTVSATEIPSGTCDPTDFATQKSKSKKGDYFEFVYSVSENTGDSRTARFTFAVNGKHVSAEVQQAGVEKKPLPDAPANFVGLGWNLGNQFDAQVNGVAGETVWGNPATTQALFDKLRADGFHTVRIPVTWLGKVGAAPEYKIDEAWLNRIYEVVGYAEKAGLRAIINIHHDGANSQYWLNVKKAATDAAFNQQVKDQLAAMWTQIARKFAEKGEFLIFEPFNEIHDGGWGWGDNRKDGGKQYACVNEWNQVFFDAVRATGGNNATRYLAAVGYCTNPDLTMDQLVLPKDSAKDRILVAVHYYDPNSFTLDATKTEWGHTGAAGKKETWGNEADVEKLFGRLKAKYVDKGIPVYLGEAGCVHHSTARAELFRKYYMEYVFKAARENCLGIVVWDNGSKGSGNECHGYYTHDNGSYINNSAEIIEVMTRAYNTSDPAYTLKSVYDSAPE